MASRDYQNDYPSVTQALGVLRKIGLEMWFKFNTAKFCDEKSKKGRLVGTQIHEAIHTFIQDEQVKIVTEHKEEVVTALQSFILFTKENPQIKLINSEVALTSELFKFNGTEDCAANDGEDVIADWKTGECKKKDKPPIYDEYIYQASAYVYLHNEVHKTDIKKAYIVALAKDKVAYNLLPLDKDMIDGCFHNAFLPALKIYNYQKALKERRKDE